MSRTQTALAMAVLLVVAGAGVPVVMAQSAATETETPTETAPTDGTNDRPNESANGSAGERLQGAIGAQEAEVDGEIRTRRFGIRTARAASDDAKAAVVAEELADVEARLDELAERKQRLRQARDAGTISQGRYRAEMARLTVETGTAESLANESADTAAALPADVRDSEGIDVAAIRALSERADELASSAAADGSDGTSERVVTTDRTGNRTATSDGGAGTATPESTDSDDRRT